jgi:SOS-response transcriptional repressor LexA
MNPPLHQRQQDILTYIARCKLDGEIPSVREIGRAVHISSTSVVRYHLAQLEKKGHISLDRGKARSIKLLIEPSPDSDQVAALKAEVTRLKIRIQFLEASRRKDRDRAAMATVTG